MERQTELLEVVLALDLSRRLAGRLDGRQEKRHEHADDRDHDQQLNERKRARGSTRWFHLGPSATGRVTARSCEEQKKLLDEERTGFP